MNEMDGQQQRRQWRETSPVSIKKTGGTPGPKCPHPCQRQKLPSRVTLTTAGSRTPIKTYP
jgi:hypothetical protein